jgi:KamA family protein
MDWTQSLKTVTSSISPPVAEGRRFRVYTERHLNGIERLNKLPKDFRFGIRVVAHVFPFRVNNYVIDELIDWDRVPDDPLFKLVFPQPELLREADFERMATVLKQHGTAQEIQATARNIRSTLNPHPADQTELNIPMLDGEPFQGIQHKYRETVLFFPSQGQTCHSYCTFCFRWPQFVGDKTWRFASHEVTKLTRYLRSHPEVTDLLITGGDPMVMKTRNLATYLETLLAPGLGHVQSIRIGTKSLSFWPYRFVSDADADELLRQLERLVRRGKHVALMAHYNHWRELDTPIAQDAIRRVRDTGVVIRSQGPLLRGINDQPQIWARLWRDQVRAGMVPYYMFVERDTGPRHYYEVPLVKAWAIYQRAMQSVSGLARSTRGPSMSCGPGKIEVQGISEIQGEKVIVLRFIQGRNPDWAYRPFFARFDEHAAWYDQLTPAFTEREFFFESEYRALSQCAMHRIA